MEAELTAPLYDLFSNNQIDATQLAAMIAGVKDSLKRKRGSLLIEEKFDIRCCS
jgi:hypothetical protein